MKSKQNIEIKYAQNNELKCTQKINKSVDVRIYKMCI